MKEGLGRLVRLAGLGGARRRGQRDAAEIHEGLAGAVEPVAESPAAALDSLLDDPASGWILGLMDRLDPPDGRVEALGAVGECLAAARPGLALRRVGVDLGVERGRVRRRAEGRPASLQPLRLRVQTCHLPVERVRFGIEPLAEGVHLLDRIGQGGGRGGRVPGLGQPGEVGPHAHASPGAVGHSGRPHGCRWGDRRWRGSSRGQRHGLVEHLAGAGAPLFGQCRQRRTGGHRGRRHLGHERTGPWRCRAHRGLARHHGGRGRHRRRGHGRWLGDGRPPDQPAGDPLDAIEDAGLDRGWRFVEGGLNPRIDRVGLTERVLDPLLDGVLGHDPHSLWWPDALAEGKNRGLSALAGRAWRGLPGRSPRAAPGEP